MRTRNVEIRVVANGYIVLPPRDAWEGKAFDGNEHRVFETFEALVAWLAEKLERPVEWAKPPAVEKEGGG